MLFLFEEPRLSSWLAGLAVVVVDEGLLVVVVGASVVVASCSLVAVVVANVVVVSSGLVVVVSAALTNNLGASFAVARLAASASATHTASVVSLVMPLTLVRLDST